MENAFLDCNIWSVHSVDQPYIDNNFFLVSDIYYYNSLTSGIFNLNNECIQIPEFEIKNLHLLDGLDFNLINNNSIPILYNANGIWAINLNMYENYKLQYNII